tara:strand:+ start:3228 stop:3419 length:192 start_codon:yes stop_codon:yes gene_type:complete
MITLDGKEYKKENLSDEQAVFVEKLINLQGQKNNLQSQLDDLNILSGFYVNKFKEVTDKPKEK